MNASLLFWIPASLRMAMVLLASGLLWLFFGMEVALGSAVMVLTVLVVMQLHYLKSLADWLNHPEKTRLPDGWGAWSEVFSRLYKFHRVDEKNRAELVEWLARFRQAMRLLPDGVVIMDDVLHLEWCNPAAAAHLGLDEQRDKGMRVTNLVRNPDFIDYIVLGRYDVPLTLKVKARKLIVQIIPFEARRQIMVTHDVTDADRIDMMRRDFVANASHELRTPLTVINGFLEIAQGQPNLDPTTRAGHLKLMIEQGQRMQNLVEDMLTLTRLESIETPLRPEQIAIPALLEQILDEARALSNHRHTINLHIDGPNIRGGKEELRSAFSNLVLNAVRYTPDKGDIQLVWSLKDAGPEFSVIDNGIGISEEHIVRLTERFYRVDKGRSRETKGTGLGLAIVKHVLIRHHATLVVDSVPQRGSTFTVRFPMNAVVQD